VKKTKVFALIENFTRDELKCKCGCGMFNMSDKHLVNIQCLRNSYDKPLIVTSGCRCIKHNKNSGGVPKSRHECQTKEADATDFTTIGSKSEDLMELYEQACVMDCFKEVLYYKKSKFVHVATYPDKPEKIFKIIDK